VAAQLSPQDIRFYRRFRLTVLWLGLVTLTLFLHDGLSTFVFRQLIASILGPSAPVGGPVIWGESAALLAWRIASTLVLLCMSYTAILIFLPRSNPLSNRSRILGTLIVVTGAVIALRSRLTSPFYAEVDWTHAYDGVLRYASSNALATSGFIIASAFAVSALLQQMCPSRLGSNSQRRHHGKRTMVKQRNLRWHSGRWRSLWSGVPSLSFISTRSSNRY
jgi:hypothetical protein